LVLSGGIDIHPALYGGSQEYPKAPERGWERGRDLFEQAALEQAWARGLPVLGVCRGLQLINITLKGTLVQDLGDAGDKIHERDGVDKQHPVHLVADTLLAEVTGLETAEANSAHHQALDRLGDGLVVNCRAEDGTRSGGKVVHAGGAMASGADVYGRDVRCGVIPGDQGTVYPGDRKSPGEVRRARSEK
jgi:putative glutamine amidotransferase